MNLPYCASFDVSTSFYEGTNNGSFICQGNSVAGYGLDIIYIISGGTQIVYSDTTLNT